MVQAKLPRPYDVEIRVTDIYLSISLGEFWLIMSLAVEACNWQLADSSRRS